LAEIPAGLRGADPGGSAREIAVLQIA
jgi:hypothetical protein